MSRKRARVLWSQQTLVVNGLKNLSPLCVPLLSQLIMIPRVVKCGGSEKGIESRVLNGANLTHVEDVSLA